MDGGIEQNPAYGTAQPLIYAGLRVKLRKPAPRFKILPSTYLPCSDGAGDEGRRRQENGEILRRPAP